MFGLIVKFVAHSGKRDDFIRILSGGMRDLPGCHSYIFAEDAEEADAIWVTEIWTDSESHDAAVALPRIQAVIAEAKPLMARRDARFVTTPIAGAGL